MFHQGTRDLYFAALLPLNKLNYWRWIVQRKARSATSEIHLHLGCGPKYLRGFVNVDGNLFRKTDLWLDLRNGLPYPDGSISTVYSSHVLEHFYPDELHTILCECHRVLRPGGGLRIVVPDMGGAVRAYLTGRADFFASFPRDNKSLGGKLSNLLFCEGGHRQGLDFSYLLELLQNAGFQDVRQLQSHESYVYAADIFSLLQKEEAGVSAISLFVEARKLSGSGNGKCARTGT